MDARFDPQDIERRVLAAVTWTSRRILVRRAIIAVLICALIAGALVWLVLPTEWNIVGAVIACQVTLFLLILGMGPFWRDAFRPLRASDLTHTVKGAEKPGWRWWHGLI